MIFRTLALVALMAAQVSGFAAKAGAAGASQVAIETFQKRFGSVKPGTRYDIPEAKLKGTFTTLAKVYGEEDALDMVKTVPECLAYNADYFKGTFEVFCETFGEEPAKGMVKRNPNLLAVKPSGWGGAGGAKEDTMALSYVIAVTRPLGPFLLAGVAALLAIPAIEGITGQSRADLFGL